MRTKNKILLGLAASSGVVASFGVAFAIYQNPKGGANYSIGIGGVESKTQSNDNLTYTIGTIAAYSNEKCEGEPLTNFKFTPEDDGNVVYFKAPLKFTNPTERTDKNSVNQKYAVGTLKVDVEVNSAIAKLGNVKATAKLCGYDDTAVKGTATDTYFTKHKSGDFFVTDASGTKDTFNETTNSVTHYIDTAIDEKNIYCVIGLDLSSTITTANFLDVAGITDAFKITLNWGEYDTSQARNGKDLDSKLNPDLWITGDKNGWVNDKINNDYQLVPNLAGEYYTNSSSDAKVEWMYAGLETFSQMKVYDNALDGKWISCRNPETEWTDATEEHSKNPGVKKDATSGNALLTVKDGYAYDVYYIRGGENDKSGFWVSGSGAGNTLTAYQAG